MKGAKTLTGSVQKKKGYFYIVLNFYDDSGKRLPKWFATGLTVKNNKKKADEILNEYLIEYAGREKLSSYSDMLVGNYVELYLNNRHDCKTISEITYQNHLSDLKHIRQFFDPLNVKMKEIKPYHIKDLYIFLLSKGKISKKKDGEPSGLSRKTVQHVETLMKNALKEAIIYGIFKENPCNDVVVPKTSVRVRDEEFLDEEDTKYFLSLIKGTHLEYLYIFALFYGMRRSEVLGLKWDAINFSKKEFAIRHTITASRTIIKQDSTKTAESHRTYPIPEFIADILIKIKNRQTEAKKFYKGEYFDTGYVFTWEDGRTYTPNYFTHAFKKIVTRDDRLSSDLRLHDLRASCVSLLMEENANIKDIQKWIGHEDENTTLKYYAKVKDRKKKIISSGMEEKFITLTS